MNIGMAEEPDRHLRADEAELVALVKNLVDNAIRYTPAGGRIDLSVQAGDGSVVLCVADSGPGIPPEERRRVFDPFYRIVGHPGIGSGLGLSIVEAIAGRMGARVVLGYADERARTGLAARVEVPSHDGAARSTQA
ncbi:MAG: sensor histidine kinase, partial [Burkholderiaceae bacterium]